VTAGPGREPITALDASVFGNEADLAWSRSPENENNRSYIVGSLYDRVVRTTAT
jgi:hypothetical protein